MIDWKYVNNERCINVHSCRIIFWKKGCTSTINSSNMDLFEHLQTFIQCIATEFFGYLNLYWSLKQHLVYREIKDLKLHIDVRVVGKYLDQTGSANMEGGGGGWRGWGTRGQIASGIGQFLVGLHPALVGMENFKEMKKNPNAWVCMMRRVVLILCRILLFALETVVEAG